MLPAVTLAFNAMGTRGLLAPITLTALTVLAACAPPPALRAPEIADRAATVNWPNVLIDRLAPLSCDRGDRWPMILWEGVGFEPLPVVTIQALLARGIVPHLPPKAASIPAAKALMNAGAPVILMAGENGTWGYGRPETYVPSETGAWSERAGEMRALMTAFRDAGVTVDAVWLDYEVEPLRLSYDAVLADPETLGRGIPPESLASPDAFAIWKRRLWTGLMSVHVAAPIHEVFPTVSITNWSTVVSTAARPVPSLVGTAIPPSDPGNFTATNPVAYGTDAAFFQLGGRSTMSQDQVDRIYMSALLGPVSVDAANRADGAPHLDSVPWVARWVPLRQQPFGRSGGIGVRVDPSPRGLRVRAVGEGGPAAAAGIAAGDIITHVSESALTDMSFLAAIERVRGAPGTPVDVVVERDGTATTRLLTRIRIDGGQAPIMSRERYREALRHIWLRGADALQVFNSATPGHTDVAIAEIVDAQAVYGEMLAVRDVLDNGDPMTLTPPSPDDTVLWSGRILGNTAVIRVVGIGLWQDTIALVPWPGTTIAVPVSETGTTWRLTRNPTTGLIERAIVPAACE